MNEENFSTLCSCELELQLGEMGDQSLMNGLLNIPPLGYLFVWIHIGEKPGRAWGLEE